MLMAVLLQLPLTISAQGSRSAYGGLFGTHPEKANNDHGVLGGPNRGTTTFTDGGIINQGYGETVSLGSGVAIMLVAAAGYVVFKKKED